MLSMGTGGGVRLCDGLTRREAMKVGAIGLGGLSLPGLLRANVARAGSGEGPTEGRPPKFGKAKSVIVFCTNGGTAQMDSFDPKPDGPAEVRGEFRAIETAANGVRISEPLPLLAKLADKFAVVRSLHHNQALHPGGIYLSLCGGVITRQITPESATMSREDRPHFGAVLSKVLPPKPELPGWVMLPAAMGPNGPEWPGQFAGYLGSSYDPYRLNSDPNQASYSPGALASDSDLSFDRVKGRRSLLREIASQSEYLDKKSVTQALDPHYVKAFDIISSPAAQRAFDIAEEPEAVRDRYGRHYFGQGCLLARRLVEAGVRLVQVNWQRGNVGNGGGQGYDTHRNHYESCRKELYPPTDQGFSALLEDLEARGLLEETIVLFSNEFGRTPKINPTAGRDHWPSCYSILAAGGGFVGGQAYGASDKLGAYPSADPITPQDFLVTLYHLLGIDTETTFHDQLNRPQKLQEGTLVRGLI